jgi:hypothetical protein
VPEFGDEGLEQLQDRLSELSERQATNARILLEEIERRRREAREQGRSFVALDAAQILDRLQRANTPFIGILTYSSEATTPGTMFVDVNVFNPDPVSQGALFVHVFIGMADIAVTLLDERFPRLTEPEPFGLNLNPSTSGVASFAIAVPANIELSTYLVNCFLYKVNTFAPAIELDRARVVFRVI